MTTLTDILSRRAQYLILVLVVVLSISLMLLSARKKDLAVHAVSDAATAPVQRLISGVRGLTGLRAENDSLRTELARQALVIAELLERNRESDRLRALLDFRARNRSKIVAARVIGRGTFWSEREYKIDKGRDDGVLRLMPVVTEKGLVGVVSRLYRRSALVRPIVDQKCSVSARLARTRTQGIVRWTASLGLHMTFLPFGAEVEPGDEVLSSGLGGTFPPGLPIGKVTRVTTDPTDGSLVAFVTPVADFSSIENVFVLVRSKGDAEPGVKRGDSVAAGTPAAVAASGT